MKIFSMIIWLFPILFMIHDFEEIIFIRAWQEKNKKDIQSKMNKKLPFEFEASTAAFSIAVAEEFIIISAVTIISYVINNYVLWFGLFVAFTIHLLFHVLKCISLKKYVPSVITSLIFLPICCFLIYKFYMLMQYNNLTILFSIIICTIIMVLNILILHKAMKKFDYLLIRYESMI